jgi:hypothetical protein
VLGEVELAGGFKAVHAVAEVDLVAVEGEDLLFGEGALDLDGEVGFLDLAGGGAFGGEEEVAGELHGQGRSALGAAMGDDVVPEGSGDAEDVDAPVRFEVLVFDGDDGLAKDGVEIVVVDDDAALQSKGAEGAAFLVVEFGGGGWAIALKVIDLRQIHRVDEGQAGEGPGERSESEQDGKGDASGQFAAVAFWCILRLNARRSKAAPGGNLGGGRTQNSNASARGYHGD